MEASQLIVTGRLYPHGNVAPDALYELLVIRRLITVVVST
jgi:hypothetical protein